MNLFVFLLSLEMLFVNLLTSYTCSKKKYSPTLTWGILILFTVALFAVIPFIAITRPGTGSGDGLLVVVGFLYVIPLYFLFDQSLKETILIMSSSWIYTMLVLSLSFRIGSKIPLTEPTISAFIIQTLVYMLTLYFFLKFVQKKFVKIVRMMEKSFINRMLVISLLWFFVIVMINYTWVRGHTLFFELSILLFLGCIALMTYLFFYSLVSLNQRADILQQQTKQDQLTGLMNRACLYDDMNKLIKSSPNFYIIFIDLDNFKWVNDTHGHGVGDSYLVQFVSEVQEQASVEGQFYRLSGDEFVMIYLGEDIDDLCESLKSVDFIENESGVPFQGLSLGVSEYPADADEISHLLHLADEKMCQVKKIKHHMGYSKSSE